MGFTTQSMQLARFGERRVYLTGEQGGAPRPAVIVLHEALGLNDDIVRITDRLAGDGFVACAPDLFEGRGAQPFCLLRAARDLGKGGGEVLDQIEATRTWLAARPTVRPEAIGVMGFCMGGGFAVLAAGTGNFTVAAPFYADVPKDPRKLPKLCPTVASYGAKDARLVSAPARLTAHLERAGVEHDVVTYEHAGHSFMNQHPSWLVPIARALPMHAAYDERAAEDSYARVLAFFRKHLAA